MEMSVILAEFGKVSPQGNQGKAPDYLRRQQAEHAPDASKSQGQTNQMWPIQLSSWAGGGLRGLEAVEG